MRSALVAAGLLAALVAAGCGLGPGKGTGGVSLVVTRDFGAVRVGGVRADRVPGSETVMRFLERSFAVQTRYGGGFVQAINGLAGKYGGGTRVDWFYYVNGIEADRGAAAFQLHRGDRVWWDRHDWSAAQRVPAVVGSYPEPFLHGDNGRRLPTRIDCAPGAGAACDLVARKLHAAGVPAAQAVLGTTSDSDTLRVVVGPWSAAGRDPAAQQFEGGPAASGVYARFAAGGRRLVLLDATGSARRAYATGAGIVAAMRLGDRAPTWVVAGTDAAGTLAAARAFGEPAALTDRFAVAAVSGGVVGVPVGGRT
jgi:Domain of unknown function (DUF4430)